MFAFRKNQLLYEKLKSYFKVAAETMLVFREAMFYLLDKGFDDHFTLLVNKNRQSEADADDVRRQIEMEMFQKSLLPETREDILMIIELIDKIPTQTKEVVKLFLAQKVAPLECLHGQLREIVELCVQTFDVVLEATRTSMGKSDKEISELARAINNNESLGDRLEYAMLEKIFDTELTAGEKILQKDIVTSIGAVLDLSEDVADRIVILCIKRHI